MRVFHDTRNVCYWAVLAAVVIATGLAGCAVDHLKVSMDRGAISPKVEPGWLDHRDGTTNAP